MRGKKKSEHSRRPTVQIPPDLFCVYNCLSFILYPSLLPLPLFRSSAACASNTHAVANAPRGQTNAQIWLDRPKMIVPLFEEKRYTHGPPPHPPARVTINYSIWGDRRRARCSVMLQHGANTGRTRIKRHGF